MKKKSIAAILLLSMLLVGCSPSNNQNTAETSTQAETLPTQQASNTEAESTQETEADPSPIFPKFEGIDISEDGLKFSTLNNNNFYCQVFCYNEDIIYFSNPSDEWKLYSYDGENLKKLTDIKAFSPNYFNGCIYFLSNSNFDIDSMNPQPKSGKLYKYDTQSGEVVKMSDISMFCLFVCESGIFYMDLAYNNNYSNVYNCIYKFDPESGESTLDHKALSPQYIEGYNIVIEPSEGGDIDSDYFYFDYYLEGKGEKIMIVSKIFSDADCIHNGFYYFWDFHSRSLYSINLQTGENTLLCKNSKRKYTICQNEVYGADQNYLYRLKDGKAETIKIENNERLLYSEINDYYLYKIENIFSNGKTVYALVDARHYVGGTGVASSREYKFAELEFSEYGVHVIEDYPDDLVYVKPIT